MFSFSVSSAFVLLLLLSSSPNVLQDREGAPEKPHNLRAFSDFSGATAVAELEWHDGSQNELGFEVLRSDNSEKFRVIGTVGANTVHYNDKIGKYITGAFAYKIRAFNQAGKSEASNIVSVWF